MDGAPLQSLVKYVPPPHSFRSVLTTQPVMDRRQEIAWRRRLGGREEALGRESGGWVLVPLSMTFHKSLSLSGPWQDGAGLSLKVLPLGTSGLLASPSLHTPQAAVVLPRTHWPSHLNMESAFFLQ